MILHPCVRFASILMLKIEFRFGLGVIAQAAPAEIACIKPLLWEGIFCQRNISHLGITSLRSYRTQGKIPRGSLPDNRNKGDGCNL